MRRQTIVILALLALCLLVSTVMPLFKWLWLLIALSVIAAFAYVYLVVIRKIRYNRLMGGLE